MSVRILGGVAKSFELATPDSRFTRPTSVMLRRRFFDAHQDVSHITFVDLCAGSGAIGLEALSRGAKSVYLVEENRKASEIIKNNIKKLTQRYDSLGKCSSIKLDFRKWFKSYYNEISDENIYLFFDPPYEKIELYKEFFETLEKVEFKGKLIIEACEQKTMRSNDFEELYGKGLKVFKQGTSYLIVYDYE